MSISANAQRVRDSRARTRANIGDNAYKAQEAAKRKARRHRTQQETTTVTHSEDSKNELENCNDLLKLVTKAKMKLAKASGKIITEKTIANQFTKVQNIYKFMNDGKKSNCTDLGWVRNTKNVISFIQSGDRWKTKSSQNSQLSALASILVAMKGYEQAYTIYSNLSSENAKEMGEDADEIKLTENEKQNIVPWHKIQNIYKKTTGEQNLESKALIALLTLLPPRRNQDYRLLTLSNNVKLANANKSYNYLIVDKNINPIKLIYNKFKTAKSFGTQEFNVPPRLGLILKAYIKDYEIEMGEPLFYTKKGGKKGYHANFTQLITNVFKPHTGKNTTINLLRHALITDFLSKKRTPAQKKRLANLMGHSVAQQALYDRIDLQN